MEDSNAQFSESSEWNATPIVYSTPQSSSNYSANPSDGYLMPSFDSYNATSYASTPYYPSAAGRTSFFDPASSSANYPNTAASVIPSLTTSNSGTTYSS